MGIIRWHARISYFRDSNRLWSLDMRNIFPIILSLFIALPAWADNTLEPLLNTVILQLNAEQWVPTKTALVTIGVNATMNGTALEKAQNEILTKLGQISNKGEWHIVSFDRSLDQSGLEKVQISAQARLPSSDLSGLRDRAKAITVPGETFTLDNVEFTPSDQELRDANTSLRSDIYQQAKNEIASLNKLYPDQKFYLHNVNFQNIVMPMPMAQNAMYMRGVSNMAGIAAPMTKVNNIAVGNKLNITAVVVVASAPDQDVTKMVHG